jgi:hypothetical protein
MFESNPSLSQMYKAANIPKPAMSEPDIITRPAPLLNVEPLDGDAVAEADCFTALALATVLPLTDAALLTQFVVVPCEMVKFPE